MFKKIGVYLGATAALALASFALPGGASVDVTGITDSVSDVAVVGAAIIGVLVAVAAFKFIRKAF